ncbi:MAG: bifunctional DNA primase/polymerase [Egibacteraceae bacterium]
MKGPLAAAALDYAERGIPVFPCHWPRATANGLVCSCGDRACSRPAKHPLTPHGFHDATSRPDVIERWVARVPDANLAIPTGAAFDVLDVDGPTGRSAIRALAARHGLDLTAAPVVRTGSGWHVLFAPTGESSRVGILPGVDWRGAGGYVIAPPSRHITGHVYSWTRPLSIDLHRLPTAPVALRDLLSRPSREPEPPPTDLRRGDRYGRAALNAELARLRAAEPGTERGRNWTLNRAAFRCYQLAAAGLLDEADVTAAFTAAARDVGLGHAEIARTLRSARAAGLIHPREIARQARRRGGTER